MQLHNNLDDIHNNSIPHAVCLNIHTNEPNNACSIHDAIVHRRTPDPRNEQDDDDCSPGQYRVLVVSVLLTFGLLFYLMFLIIRGWITGEPVE